MEYKYNETKEIVCKGEDIGCGHDKKLVWSWKGVVVNIPTRMGDGRFVGESGSKRRDKLRRRGFNPLRVTPLWNYRGHSGNAIVEFNKNWHGFHNAMSFDKASKAEHKGRKDWYASGDVKSGLYAWVACADDYNARGIIGDSLRKSGNLKTVVELMEGEARKQDELVSNLTNIIEVQSKQLKEMEVKCGETSLFIQNVMREKDGLVQAYNEGTLIDIRLHFTEMRKTQQSERDHYQRICNDNEKLKLQVESQKREIELRSLELEKREAQNESQSKKLAEEMEKVLNIVYMSQRLMITTTLML
ncbi:XS domain-containing protein [Cephalotus follicularis]|uniref:XS domain-containing protein n=1 Tax=Cephalotus follicularis TaxID=3775 RepID=A0A1Q3BQL0_CEPFO|nr:XS domain-containing protein [Cephalotus follicularis]